jgi:membrane-associated protein
MLKEKIMQQAGLKILAIIIMAVGFVEGGYAQTDLRLKIIDQYESPAGEFSVQATGGTTNYTTDKEGFATIKILAGEEVVITAEAHDTTRFVYAKLSAEKTVVLRKDFSYKDLLNPMFYIIYGGLWLLLLIVFAETGLFAGFFLPGDSLLFVAGIYSNNLAHEFLKLLGLGGLKYEWLDLFVLVALISFAGIIGNSLGYWFGKKIGPTMFRWKDNFFFKKRYLDEAHDFYDKHGGGAIVFARFLPIVRTFAPIIAGIVGMEKKKFALFNIIGCISWVISMIFAGHFLQKWVKHQFGFELKEHLEVIVIGIILVTTAPVIFTLITGKAKSRSLPPE